MQRGIFRAVLFLVVVCQARAALGAEVIFSYTGGSGSFQGGIMAGNSFGAPGGATFNSLGFLDAGNDGINGSYPIGLWDAATQILLASTIVTPSSPLINGFRYAPIPTTTIAPGSSFTIAAQLPSTMLDGWLTNASLNMGPGFTGSGAGKFLGTNLSLAYPAQNDGATYVIVNASDQVVPEPASILGGALGFATLFMRRRRRG